MVKKIIALLMLIVLGGSAFAQTNLYQKNSNPTPALDDLLYTVDVSDSTDNPNGSDRKTTVQQLLTAGDITIDGTNVGIGDTSPEEKLTVGGNVKATGFIGDGSGLTNVSAGGWSGDGTSVYLTNSTDNVGIGISSPTEKLQVIGNIESNGQYQGGVRDNSGFYYASPSTVDVVFIGTSMTFGTPNSGTPSLTMPGYFGAMTNMTYINAGIGGDTTSGMLARFQTDVINQHPMIVVIEWGPNDLPNGVSSEITVSNIETMLSMAVAAGIKPILIPCLPADNRSNDHWLIMEGTKKKVAALASKYNAIVADASQYVGKARSTGPAGNFWDIISAYNSDGVHYLPAGYKNVARAVVDKLPRSLKEKNTIYFNSGNVGIGSTTPRSVLDIDKGTGVGQITINGSTGGCLMIRDTDDSGWTECDALNGVMTCSIDADGICD